MTKEHTSYTWNIARNSNLNFTCPHPGMVLWIRIGGVKRMCQNAPADHLMGLCWPPEHAQPVWQGCPLTLGSTPL